MNFSEALLTLEIGSGSWEELKYEGDSENSRL